MASNSSYPANPGGGSGEGQAEELALVTSLISQYSTIFYSVGGAMTLVCEGVVVMVLALCIGSRSISKLVHVLASLVGVLAVAILLPFSYPSNGICVSATVVARVTTVIYEVLIATGVFVRAFRFVNIPWAICYGVFSLNFLVFGIVEGTTLVSITCSGGVPTSLGSTAWSEYYRNLSLLVMILFAHLPLAVALGSHAFTYSNSAIRRIFADNGLASLLSIAGYAVYVGLALGNNNNLSIASWGSWVGAAYGFLNFCYTLKIEVDKIRTAAKPLPPAGTFRTSDLRSSRSRRFLDFVPRIKMSTMAQTMEGPSVEVYETRYTYTSHSLPLNRQQLSRSVPVELETISISSSKGSPSATQK